MEPKYKWLRVRNYWTDELIVGGESEIENLPEGWYIAFGEQMIDELNELLIKYNFVDEYRIAQIKEKFGGLRWYDNGFPVEGQEEYKQWLSKYEELSERICIDCGKEGKLRNLSWIVPLCDEHYNKLIESRKVKL